MTDDALLKALQDACRTPEGGDGMTTHELTAATGMPGPRVREMLRAMLRAGTIAVGRRTMPALDGRMVHVPSYRLS